MSKLIGVFGLLGFVIFLVAIGPILGIWALNTLFHTGIEYTFTNWAAAAILVSLLQNTVKIKKNG